MAAKLTHLRDELFEVVIQIVNRVLFDAPRSRAQRLPFGHTRHGLATARDERVGRALQGRLQHGVFERRVRASRQVLFGVVHKL